MRFASNQGERQQPQVVPRLWGKFAGCSTAGYVHAISEDVATIDDDVPDIDADPKLDPLVLWNVGVALCHASLNIDSAPHGIYDAAEFSQHSVDGILHDPAAMSGDLGIDQDAQVFLQPNVRALLIHAVSRL
jgi:hypothetical protein